MSIFRKSRLIFMQWRLNLSIGMELYFTAAVLALMDEIPQSIQHNIIRFRQNHMDWIVENRAEVIEGHISIWKSQELP